MTSPATRPHRQLRRPPPPLEPGDHMRAAEFLQRYEAMPQLKKAELLRGIVYTQPSVPFCLHAEPHAHMVGWLGTYRMLTDGSRAGDNCTVRLDDLNVPQPDVLMFIPAAAGGQTIISDDGFVAGAPELVAEVATSSRSLELGVKREVWEEFGAIEYIVWRVADDAIDWFIRRGDRYEPLSRGPDGIFRSEVFPGLWLDPAALIAGDMARVLAVVEQGCATPEHAAFVRRLAGTP